MKKVIVKSVFDAFDYVMNHYYCFGQREFTKLSDTYAVISIQDTHTQGFGFKFTENEFCKGVLTLFFDDIVREIDGAVLFTKDMALQIIEFILSHKRVDTLLVHCYGGQSRSRAVGAFAVKMLGADNNAYFKNGSPNMYVYDLLENTWLSHHAKNTPKPDDDALLESLLQILNREEGQEHK